MINKLITILILLFGNAIGQRIPVDKQEHFAAGLVIGVFSVTSSEVKHPFWTSVTVATAAGIAKEFYDNQLGNKFDTPDIYFTIAGGAVSGSIAYLIKRRKTKRKEYLKTKWMYRHYSRY